VGGIIGKLMFDRHVEIARPTVQRMLDAVGAAARDERCATYLAGGIALGVSSRSRARVGGNESHTIHVVADSDLLNAASLRHSLDRLGHAVDSGDDAELMAHAYEEWGDACVEHFSGPFAFAIWDLGERRLLLARDHVGMRPLSFALLHDSGVVFGSDIRALLEDPSVNREWHPEAVDAYLAHGYVPAPLTLYRGISKLESAHLLVVEGRRLTTRRYWDLPATTSDASEREAIDLVESCLRASVAAHTAHDAALLTSGGVASTALTTVSPAEVPSVTVAANVHADRLVHTLVRVFDEPQGDPVAIEQLAVLDAARGYADLAVTGHGAGALWGGRHRVEVFADDSRHAIYTRRFSWQVHDATHSLDRGALSVLSDSVLAIAHRAAGAACVRLRHPCVDREMADLAFTLPDNLKRRGSTDMYALRQLVARRDPNALSHLSLGEHEHAWLPRAVERLVPQVLLGPGLEARGIFNRQALATLWDEHRAGSTDHSYRLWSLVVLELWFRQFIDGDAEARPLDAEVLVRAA
jgi:asparagine synthetase B (glutamine-hydrolysing)